ncbi:flippase-like domain-containing protein [Pedobacter sp.]|nr:flippase-like domain-containing protein [Candidatus Saccharibacteria bacterium]
MSNRHWLTIGTAVLVIIVLFLTRNELVQAWHLLRQVNPGILLFIFPLQALSYYAVGAMIFSYLKQKENFKVSSVEMTKMALELNFVNHVLPSGGVSGASYMTWRLKHLGVGAGRSALAQVVRFIATFGAFLTLLMIALLIVTLDGGINRLTILVTSGLAFSIIFGTMFVTYIIDSEERLKSFSKFITKWVNTFWMKMLRRPKQLLTPEKVTFFFAELHEDYLTLKREPRMLIRPIAWGFVFNLCEVGMFFVAFWALGTPVNPAPLLIAYGIASVAGFFIATPGGAGGYEILMITFLSAAGLSQGAVVAGVLLARTLLIVTTILSGYVFYHLALEKYGTHTVKS